MSTAETTKQQLPAIQQTRLPYHPGIKERFGIDQTEWRALVESTFPSAQSVGSVILALAYCRARNLDPFKKTVHIVPIYDKASGGYVETVWPGIAEYRTTATRTGTYAGHDECQHGPMITKTWEETDKSGKKYNDVTVAFPEWSQMTVYRIVGGERQAFPGPRVYWTETYASKKTGCPNTMWADRPIGMIDKCAEAAALRGAFPEELGGEPTYEENGGFRWHGRDAIDVKTAESDANRLQLETALRADSPKQTDAERFTEQQPENTTNTPDTSAEADAVQMWIDTIDGETDVEAVKAATCPTDWTAASQQRFNDVKAARIKKLTRGERSNPGQKTLV